MNSQPSGADTVAPGPLGGVRVIEIGSIGPAPFAAMMLADMGADVLRVERRGASAIVERGPTVRGRRVVEMDLKSPDQRDALLSLAERCDILIEGFRPGVMERLGMGPDDVHRRNPRVVYGRMTGWGQSGPLAHTAGHDINYIAVTGALHAMGPADRVPPVPLNLVGDYGGGALFLVSGLLAAHIEASRSGRGQIVDAAICDGTLSLISLFHQLQANRQWLPRRHSNTLDGAAPFYRAYECLDGKFLAVGALEPQFYAALRRIAGWQDAAFDHREDPAQWPALNEQAEAIMRTRTRDEWMQAFAGSDACVAPVLTLEESTGHPHLRARGCHILLGDQWQPAPAPRFSRTPSRAWASTALGSVAALDNLWRTDHPAT